ncbi:hypothetical protein QN239_27405 [Mycolicibacterium sp. Y3]
MDTTSAIAIAGLSTALLGTLTVPLLQSYFTSRRESGLRLDERRYDAYVDAISYAQIVEEKLTELTEDPVARTYRAARPTPDAVMIRAKLVLVAPTTVARAFDELAVAWDDLRWVLSQESPVRDYGDGDFEYFLERDHPNVVRVTAALNALRTGVRPKPLGDLPPPPVA